MLLKKQTGIKWIIAAIAFATVAGCLFLFMSPDEKNITSQTDGAAHMRPNADRPHDPGSPTVKNGNSVDNSGVVSKKIIRTPEIDYKDIEILPKLKELMDERKKKAGIKDTLDMIVRSNETFTVGKTRIAMSDILKQAFTGQGDIFEEKIERSGEIRPRQIDTFGIYVIQAGDNIWNIHFNILKEFYLNNKGVTVSPKADEPGSQGQSSGVGKILKFSETMVIIYNLLDRKIDTHIDLIEPLSKIVIYNLDEVFSLLEDIDYSNIDRIQFDGKHIWIPVQ